MIAGTIVGVGQCSVDYLGLLPRYPDRAEVAEIAEFSQQGGGIIANALATLAVFGADTRFVGKVSDDHFGAFIRAGLEGLGVDTSFVILEHGRVSPFSFSAVEMTEGRRTVFWSRGNVSPLSITEIDEEKVLGGASALIIDTTHPEVQLRLARAAKTRGIPVILEGGSDSRTLKELIEVSEILLTSERLAAELIPASELEQTLEGLRGLGPKQCIITLGPEGSIGIDEAGLIHQERAHRVVVRDTTGAGDAFLGAYTFATQQQWPLQQSMRFASIVAGLTCQSLGARAGLPKLSLVLEATDREPIEP